MEQGCGVIRQPDLGRQLVRTGGVFFLSDVYPHLATLFVNHASEDKKAIVLPLAHVFKACGMQFY